MSAGSALKRVARPFGSAVANRRWANFADVGFAGVIVGAATVFLGAATVVHGRAQTAMIVVGFILTGIALVLAAIARLIGTRDTTSGTGSQRHPTGTQTVEKPSARRDLDEAIQDAHDANDQYESYLWGESGTQGGT
jgi:hypothetical protein